jgi:tRNA(adenine34) deaminase
MHRDPADRETRVKAEIERLQICGGDYALLDAERDRKRQAWWDEQGSKLTLSGPLPRQAYELLLIHYIGLDPAEVPVVYEDEQRIVWRSFNFCSTLEACRRLGLDTRVVCREGSHSSVQRLIAHLDPRLRFERNYAAGMRPYADYCEESVELITDS